jgi:hypothetical protein
MSRPGDLQPCGWDLSKRVVLDGSSNVEGADAGDRDRGGSPGPGWRIWRSGSRLMVLLVRLGSSCREEDSDSIWRNNVFGN